MRTNERALLLNAQAGQDLGCSDWLPVTQEMITQFGSATLDPDPMHMDPEWARSGPFGQTIAFGFLTISLLSHLLHRTLGSLSERYDPAQGYYLNYGFDRLRLVAPVPVGAKIRGHFRVAEVRHDERRRKVMKVAVQVEIQGSERVALVAEWLTIWVPPANA